MRESTLHTDSIGAADATNESVAGIQAPSGYKRMVLNMGP